MKTIGITGGVGAGKTKVLSYINDHYNCRIIYADDVANKIKEPGERCYFPLIELLGTDILNDDGSINKGAMATKIFADQTLLLGVNAILHPAVKQYILDEIDSEEKAGKLDYFFVEAALLIEEKYDEILDELWYVYADPEIRRIRLKESRSYSDEKIDSIMKSQLADDIFRGKCAFVIDNSGEAKEAYRQIDDRLRGSGTDHE